METITIADTQEVIKEGTFEIKNFDDYKKQLIDTIEKSYTLDSVNEDTYSLAKDMRANLNKLKDAIDTKRKKYEKLYMKPFAVGKAQYKDLCTIVDEASKKLGDGINAMDDKFHEARKANCIDYFNNCKSSYPITFEQIFDSKWLNKSTKFDDIKTAIDFIMTNIGKDVCILNTTIEDENTRAIALWQYFKCLDLGKAIGNTTTILGELDTIRNYMKGC